MNTLQNDNTPLKNKIKLENDMPSMTSLKHSLHIALKMVFLGYSSQ